MIALKKEPGKNPEVIDIENTLQALQDEVGGYIEAVTIAADAVVICNEDGRLRGMEPNCTIARVDFVGPILVVGREGEEFCGLDPHVADRLADMFAFTDDMVGGQ